VSREEFDLTSVGQQRGRHVIWHRVTPRGAAGCDVTIRVTEHARRPAVAAAAALMSWLTSRMTHGLVRSIIPTVNLAAAPAGRLPSVRRPLTSVETPFDSVDIDLSMSATPPSFTYANGRVANVY